eukprot:jgi/Ulvmu1/11695/UM008_0105.1
MDDDESPPSLDELSTQVSAISNTPTDVEVVADVTFAASAPVANKSTSIRRGFFNAKPSGKSGQRTKKASNSDIPTIKAKGGVSSGPQIPDFLMVEPSEQEKRLQAEKMNLLNKLTPTEESVKEAMHSPDLAAGFDDPEVMKAVQDIGSNPGLMRTKYANNKKVQRFYAAMAGHVGQRLTSLDASTKSG